VCRDRNLLLLLGRFLDHHPESSELLAAGCLMRSPIALLLILPILALPGSAEEALFPSVQLEAAPRDIGALRSEGLVLIQALPTGGEVALLDIRSGKLHRFGETGHERGDPVLLRTASGGAIDHVVNFAISGSQVALAAPFTTLLYKQDGQFVAEKELVIPGDITSTKGGAWAVSLGGTPFLEGKGFLGREEFPGLPPQIIELGTKLKLGRTGFQIEEEDRTISGSRAVGRTLRLAWSGDRLYAAELANYTVYEFGRDLKLRATYRDPELELENDGEGAKNRSREKEALRAIVNVAGDAAKQEGQKPAGRVFSAFNDQQVIQDIAWHAPSNRLAILVKRDVLETGPVLDLLDPQTGDVERFHLKVPDGEEGQQPISQLVVGESFLWLRARAGNQATWRVSHADLIDGQHLALPEIDILAVEEEEGTAK